LAVVDSGRRDAMLLVPYYCLIIRLSTERTRSHFVLAPYKHDNSWKSSTKGLLLFPRGYVSRNLQAPVSSVPHTRVLRLSHKALDFDRKLDQLKHHINEITLHCLDLLQPRTPFPSFVLMWTSESSNRIGVKTRRCGGRCCCVNLC
jgi:hypothetical protein